MKFKNSYCWTNWLAGIILIALGYFSNSHFVSILGGINIGYAIGGIVVIYATGIKGTQTHSKAKEEGK